MNHIVAKDYEAMSRQGALIVAGELLQQPDAVLGFATGSTPVGLYRELVELYQLGLLDFSRAASFNLDEYAGLPRQDQNSYRSFMEEILFSQVNLAPGRTHLPDGEAPHAQAECARYEAAIAASGGIHLQLLGLGHNGHIGFNEPSDHFAPDTHPVELDPRTIRANARFFGGEAAVPRRALTMGVGTILRARKILLLVSGEDKREILREALHGPITPRVPASALQLHPAVSVITDFELEM